MAEQKREHRRLDLTPQEWERLEALAEETNSRPRRGANAYQHDWRAFIKRIASGDVVVSEAKPVVHAPIPPEMEAEWQRQKEEWQKRHSSYRQLSILEAEAA